ncbi:hypothetical protein [Riemerella columbina]|uniref:hypothetical protein n=1 Tax=Riemerella columbina TaxID=103810 RepID=UPI00267059A4|nr:hypothetical protein [Riemerella columbina]WKS95475.1 hypothetical protein NYR17_01680 [Riemerella columbina]
MIKIIKMMCLLWGTLGWAQTYHLVEAKGRHENTDAFFYPLSAEAQQKAQYLGKIEVTQAAADEVQNFEPIYKKAKLTGANAYRLHFPNDMEDHPRKKHHNYEVLLYYYPFSTESFEQNIAYFFNLNQDNRIKINGKKVEIPSRHYVEVPLTPTITEVAVGGFLGSKVRLQEKENAPQPPLYFSIGASRLKGQEGSLQFKTGDIERLDDSLAQFLMLFYEKVSEN